VLADAIARGLRREAMAVDVSHDGASALERIAVNHYDVVLLDRDIPVVHGDDVCRRLATEALSPRILMLTASAGLEDRVEGLTLGADDYLGKPFAFTELVARVRALGRRVATAQPPVIERAGLTVDPARRVASRDGRFLRLTNKELAVLEKTYRDQKANFTQDKKAAEELLSVGESARPRDIDVVELAAMTGVANVLLNLNETLTR
jgi:DNA-binding response OmpR family regulator